MSTSISQDQAKTIFKALDLNFNSTLLEAFLHGELFSFEDCVYRFDYLKFRNVHDRLSLGHGKA